jgi:hypothetical protein
VIPEGEVTHATTSGAADADEPAGARNQVEVVHGRRDSPNAPANQQICPGLPPLILVSQQEDKDLAPGITNVSR